MTQRVSIPFQQVLNVNSNPNNQQNVPTQQNEQQHIKILSTERDLNNEKIKGNNYNKIYLIK